MFPSPPVFKLLKFLFLEGFRMSPQAWMNGLRFGEKGLLDL